MPKALPADPRKRRKLIVRIGPVLRHEELRAATQGLARSAAHKRYALVRLAIERCATASHRRRSARPGRLLEASR